MNFKFLIIFILSFRQINSLSIPSIIVNDTDIDLRIVNGHDGDVSWFPFMVSVFTETRPNWGDYCGGSILNNKWILTAAHCVVINGKLANAEKISVRAGINSLDEKGSWQYKNHKAIHVFPHPQYDSENFYNDIALIELSNPIEFSDRSEPACIDYKNKEYLFLIATGYGSITPRYKIDGNLNTDNDGNKLKYAYFKETRDECSNNEMFVCIYSYFDNGDSPCFADSGSPLINLESNIIGIFSNLPGIKVEENKYEYCEGHAKYTRLSAHFNFINQYIGLNYCWFN